MKAFNINLGHQLSQKRKLLIKGPNVMYQANQHYVSTRELQFNSLVTLVHNIKVISHKKLEARKYCLTKWRFWKCNELLKDVKWLSQMCTKYKQIGTLFINNYSSHCQKQENNGYHLFISPNIYFHCLKHNWPENISRLFRPEKRDP